MSENNFTPLMAEFLRNLAQELENNKAMARRLAEPFQAMLTEVLVNSGSKAKSKSGKSDSKQKKYPVPEGFDPYKVFYDLGSPGLYNQLNLMGVDELKGVLANFTNLPRKDYARKQKQEILVEMAVQGVRDIATRGEAFGDYKLDVE